MSTDPRTLSAQADSRGLPHPQSAVLIYSFLLRLPTRSYRSEAINSSNNRGHNRGYNKGNGKPIKGRGALSNPHNRYDPRRTEAVDDGWNTDHASPDASDAPPDGVAQDRQAEPAQIPTIILKESSRTIISSNKSPDLPFDYSINPYRGCEHGCIYCYARPSHAYWDLSPGLDFETKIITKPDAARLLRDALNQPGHVVKPICIGANTDPYQPLEAGLKTTRSIIEVLAEFRHPFSIITKSRLVLRDLDLLAPLAESNLCSVAVSVTTLDNDLKRKLEPRAASGRVRLEAIRKLTDAGVRVTLLAAPMIPCINDNELESILKAGKEAGAASAGYILLRLPLEVSAMFQDWLAAHYPDRAAKVMSVIRQSRGGKDYRSVFGERMRGTGEFAALLNRRFEVAARRLGLGDDRGNNRNNNQKTDQKKSTRFTLDCSQFKRRNEQLELF